MWSSQDAVEWQFTGCVVLGDMAAFHTAAPDFVSAREECPSVCAHGVGVGVDDQFKAMLAYFYYYLVLKNLVEP